MHRITVGLTITIQNRRDSLEYEWLPRSPSPSPSKCSQVRKCYRYQGIQCTFVNNSQDMSSNSTISLLRLCHDIPGYIEPMNAVHTPADADQLWSEKRIASMQRYIKLSLEPWNLPSLSSINLRTTRERGLTELRFYNS